MNPVSNRNPAEWIRLCAELELSESFEAIFEDDKTEYELSDPRYIEDFIDEDYDPYEAIGESRFGLPGGGGLGER